MDLGQLKTDQKAKIDAVAQEIERIRQNKVMLRLQELEEEYKKRIEELGYLERLEQIPNLDSLLDKVKPVTPAKES